MLFLDGIERDERDLLPEMQDDGFYYKFMGLDKCLSYSSLKWLLKSPKWFEYKRNNPDPETQALRDGRLVHTQILEPQKYDTFNFIDVSTKNTNKWKLAVQEHGAMNTYTLKEQRMANRISQAFLQNDRAVSFLNKALTEVPNLISLEGLPIRGKADIYKPEEYVVDVKTTSDGISRINLDTGEQETLFARTISNYDYDMQAYLYSVMFNVPEFWWVVIDKATTDIGIFKASPETLELGRLKLEAALQMYDAFFVSDLIDLSQYYLESEI